MPTQGARAVLCRAHDTVVSCIGDLETSSVLTGTCPTGGEQHYYETAGGPAIPNPGVGGTHDPMHGVALAPSTPAPELAPESGWEKPAETWDTPVADQDLPDETVYDNTLAEQPATIDEAVPDHPPLVPPV